MLMMSRYPDKYFDLAIVDPPYGINADKAHNNNKGKRGYKLYKDTQWDSCVPEDNYFYDLFRVSKRQIIWGGNYFNYIWSYSNSFIFWDKGQREFTLADGELAWYSEKNKACRVFDMPRGAALADANNNGGKLHPTQKPVKLYEWLLMNYAKEGDKILDTHLGSGSIAIACHNLGFDLTACELDKDYYEAAIKRIEQHKQQLTIF